MIFSLIIILQELRVIFSSVVYYIEIIVTPVTLTLITLFATRGRADVSSVVNYIILISTYGIVQSMLNGSARSLEKEKYQDTLSLHFLANVSLWKVILNKLVANSFIGIINLVITWLFILMFFKIDVVKIDVFILGLLLLLVVGICISIILSCISLRVKSPYAMCGILARAAILATGIFIPFNIMPHFILVILSFTGIPQVFSLIMYGLSGTPIISREYMVILPIIVFVYLLLGIRLVGDIEYKYLKLGGI